jgi:hypothetical protein
VLEGRGSSRRGFPAELERMKELGGETQWRFSNQLTGENKPIDIEFFTAFIVVTGYLFASSSA